MEKLERREAFRSLFKKISKKEEGEEATLLPPYIHNRDLLSACLECDGFCIDSCEEEIIKRSPEGKPFLDFSHSGCTFCEDCAKACPSDVLSLESGEEKIFAKTEISVLKCISWDKTVCYSCKDVCLDNAIAFLGMFRPEIKENCTNCGFCVGVCPTNAIEIKANN